MTKMLASVENLAEALLVLEAGVDIIDLKSPSTGALGALPVETVSRIVHAVGVRCPLSATIGDLPMHPQRVWDAVEAMDATGVDYVKIGFFPGGDWQQTTLGLSPLAMRGVRMVAVLFGDRNPGLSHIAELAEAGFSGVMLDTMDKRGGSLTDVCTLGYLRDFVAEAKAFGMLCGLAGSLRQADIPVLLDLQPDYLGFRGALCMQHDRTAGLDGNAVRAIRKMLA
jgi:dihydroneopterin aldolase